MSELALFIPITKVDAVQRLVYGIATAEAEDRAGEICDYDSTKPYYEKWSEEIAKSTGGKSFGNLRAMHGTVAAGKITALNFNDAHKQIEICAKIIDDGEWLKVREGVYTGFSQGGAYVRRWTDTDGRQRYTAQPLEISLVDLPCLPQARFELVKADGSREWRAFGKSFSTISRLSAIIDELESLKRDVTMDPAVSAADSDLPDELGDLLDDAIEILNTLADQHLPDRPGVNDELLSQADEAGQQKHAHALSNALAKIGARNSAEDLARIQAVHDTSVELGAVCATHKHALVAQRSYQLDKGFEIIATRLDDLLRRVKNIEEQPLPLPFAGQTRAVSKGEDAAFDLGMEPSETDRDALALLAIKRAQRNGRSYLDR